MTLKILKTPIEGLMVVESQPHQDHRGVFYRAFCDQDLASLLMARKIQQVNVSRTELVGTIRGLHFQYPPAAEMKLIRCLRGRVWDVGVDLRQGSPTFLQWYGIELSSQNCLMMVIPEGFAHGLQVLEASSELLYLHTAHYTQTFEGGIRYDDPSVCIRWPLPVTELSQRDRAHTLLSEGFEGIPL